jgi:hypothetical protein
VKGLRNNYLTGPIPQGMGPTMTDTDNKKMVLENIEHVDPTDRQIIELLLLLLNDWEVRAAVMRCLKKREELEKAQAQAKISQTVIGAQNGHKP